MEPSKQAELNPQSQPAELNRQPTQYVYSVRYKGEIEFIGRNAAIELHSPQRTLDEYSMRGFNLSKSEHKRIVKFIASLEPADWLKYGSLKVEAVAANAVAGTFKIFELAEFYGVQDKISTRHGLNQMVSLARTHDNKGLPKNTIDYSELIGRELTPSINLEERHKKQQRTTITTLNKSLEEFKDEVRAELRLEQLQSKLDEVLAHCKEQEQQLRELKANQAQLVGELRSTKQDQVQGQVAITKQIRELDIKIVNCLAKQAQREVDQIQPQAKASNGQTSSVKPPYTPASLEVDRFGRKG